MLRIQFSTTSYCRGVEKAQNTQSPSITLTSRGHCYGSPEIIHSEKELPFCQSAPSTSPPASHNKKRAPIEKHAAFNFIYTKGATGPKNRNRMMPCCWNFVNPAKKTSVYSQVVGIYSVQSQALMDTADFDTPAIAKEQSTVA